MKLLNHVKKLSISRVYLILRRGIHFGYCPVCERKTLFFKDGDWWRDHYHCSRCLSIPRQRAFLYVLHKNIPNWRELDIHESSPSGLLFNKFTSECESYIPTQFFPDIELGSIYGGFRCEDLSNQTFMDESFDIVITQDVLEHLFNPIQSLKEISRTLKPGGYHVFTVPWYYWQDTKIRAIKVNNEIVNIEEPDYHYNPVDEKGSLVVTEWGNDFIDTIYACTGMTTTVFHIQNKRIGAEAKFIEVFISRKPPNNQGDITNRWEAT